MISRVELLRQASRVRTIVLSPTCTHSEWDWQWFAGDQQHKDTVIGGTCKDCGTYRTEEGLVASGVNVPEPVDPVVEHLVETL